ncbi:HalOD1 output domain-containing protein [Natronomonas sp.]|uniref:HalOD1 output domain-containing protein n=1 Tax=Natronomonas sp. TaxID=2184060 RepID=UPI002FC38865
MQNSNLTVYCGCAPVVETVYSVESNQSPAEEIINAVATAADVDPMELPPLYEYADPDAVNNLFRHKGAEHAEALLSFKIESWNVFVRADGKICVCDATQSTSPEPVFG